jgi:hypothetical protein
MSILDQIIGWKELLVNGVKVRSRPTINLLGCSVVDNPSEDRTDITLQPIVIASGTWAMHYDGTPVTVSCPAYLPGDFIVYNCFDVSSPGDPFDFQFVSSTAGSFVVQGIAMDASSFLYKVLR